VIEAITRHASAHREFLLYAAIGVTGVLLDLAAFLVLYNVLGITEFVATFLSTTLGIANNFLLNVRFNFRTRDRLLQRFLRFYAVGAAGILLTIGMFALFSGVAGIDPNVVKVVSLPVVLVFQFVLNKKWTFQP
jgi:putative flippase GtrA